MIQLKLIDPCDTATATPEMLENPRSAIRTMRSPTAREHRLSDTGRPHVERLVEIEGGTAWVVEAGETNDLVVGIIVLVADDIQILG